MKTSLLYGIVPDHNSKTRVRCIFCRVFIPKASKCIEQHTNGSQHQQNIELMSENGICYSNDALYCKPCKHTLGEDELITKHVFHDEHATWMTAIEDLVDGEFINLDPYLAGEKDDIHCEVCNKTIECTLLNLEEHVNSFDHRAKLCNKLKQLNGIFDTENNDEVWCKICDVLLENSVNSIFDHMDEDEMHVNWFSDIEDIIEGQDIMLEHYLTHENEMNIFCNKCQALIVCDMETIQEHVDSAIHQSYFTSLIA